MPKEQWREDLGKFDNRYINHSPVEPQVNPMHFRVRSEIKWQRVINDLNAMVSMAKQAKGKTATLVTALEIAESVCRHHATQGGHTIEDEYVV